jgi:VWFA-related protein
MTTTWTAWWGGARVTLAAAVLSAAPLAAQTPFRARTEIVSVDVLVRAGNLPVTGLTAADFDLRDNGVVQQVDVERADAVPVDLTLVLDVSGSATSLIEDFKNEIRLISRLLRPHDQVRLLAFAGTTVQVFGFQPGDAELPLAKLETGSGGTALDDALTLALAWIPEPKRRHLVAAFTDGAENASLVDRPALVATATRAPGLLHIVLPRPVSRAYSPSDGVVYLNRLTQGHNTLVAAAEATGGSLIISEKSAKILDGFKLVFETFRSGYVLRFTPRGVARDGWHDLAVTMKAPGKFDVRARKGYAGG